MLKLGLFIVESKGFEPMTSALSKQRSKPAELRFHFDLAKIEKPFKFLPNQVVEIK